MNATLTPGQEDRLIGLLASLDVDGRTMTADTGEIFSGWIQDQPALADPTQQAREKTPVYVSVTCLVDAIGNPRTVKVFTEADYGTIKVLRFNETRGDALTWSWFCEAQRQ